MHRIVQSVIFVVAVLIVPTSAFAQAAGPLTVGRGLAWGSLGFQGDLGGTVNESGIGVVNGQRAEIDANTWAERYDAALIFRIGGAFNITSRSQLFAAVNWEQSESDSATVGLIGGRELSGKFSDYQGWGIDAGYRHFFNTEYKGLPFVAVSVGFQRIQNITLDLSSTGFAVSNAPTAFNAADIPFYDDSWVAGWRIGAGFLRDINDWLGWQVTVDLKYSGLLSDQSGIGTIGFERINNVGNRWTLPILAGAYVKF